MPRCDENTRSSGSVVTSPNLASEGNKGMFKEIMKGIRTN